MKQIIIDIDQDGELKIQTKGFQGKDCIKDSEFIKELLGREKAIQLVPAYYTQNKQVIKKYLQLCG